MAQIQLTALPGIPLVQPGDNLAWLLLEGLHRANLVVQPGDVLVLAQKIVSKAEGRLVALDSVTPTPEALELAELTGKDPRLVALILQESNEVLRASPAGVLVVEHRLGFVSANAGIDGSNIAEHGDCVLLLPENPDATCARLREQLRAATGANVGVIINDSHGRAWRNGTVGVAIGVAGVPALHDMRGQPDLFENTLEATTIGVADELAAAASLLMGQAREGRPVVHVRGLPYSLRDSSLQELIRPREQDLFR